MKFPHERSLYRIEYPERERPLLTLASGFFPVIDCSEEGLRYLLPDGAVLPDDDMDVEGRLRFKRHSEDIQVRGTVLRCDGREVSLRLLPPGLPRGLLFSEQRFLSVRYPGRLGRGPTGRS